jgi:hypothetical protein
MSVTKKVLINQDPFIQHTLSPHNFLYLITATIAVITVIMAVMTGMAIPV